MSRRGRFRFDVAGKARGSTVARVLRYPDFRLLWIGSFISFTGGWIQNVAQGFFVYSLTQSESKLAIVTFCVSLPVFLFAFIAGTLSDQFDKRRLLVATQALLASASLFMAFAIWQGFIEYWMIVGVALFIGCVGCVEMPTRQSIVSRVVPIEELSAAVPVNAMTFNTARIFGPALGGLILASMGVALCYLINGLTFLGLIWSAVGIKSDLRPVKKEPQPILDLVFEGMRYTFRDKRLRALFLLESATAVFGIAYMPLLPAFVQQVLGHTDPGSAAAPLGYAYTAVGLGAFTGLMLVTHFAASERKGTIIRACMFTLGIGLFILSFARNPWIAYPVLSVLGACTVSQFNTTNALFQTLSPDRLRGRVLAMHIWALNGLSPFGVLFFGWLANTTRTGGPVLGIPSTGISLVLQVGGVFVTISALLALLFREGLTGLHIVAED